MNKTAWGLGLILTFVSAQAAARDPGDATPSPRAPRHHRVRKPVRHVEPGTDVEDAENAAPAEPVKTGPGGKGPKGELAGPPASAMPEAPADPNALNAAGAANATGTAPAVGANSNAGAAGAVQPNDTIDPVESVEAAPEAASGWFTDADPIFDRVFDHYTPFTVRRHTFNSFISHRNREGILRGPFYDLLGFDGGGLKVGLAVRYGVLDELDVGIYRQNGTVEIFDTWEFDGRYQLLKQSDTMPVALSVRAGLTWFSASGHNALAGFGEAMLAKRFNNAILLGLNVLYHSSSSSPTKRGSDPQGTGAAGVVADWRLLDYLSVGAEVTVGVVGYHQTYPAITVGPKFITNRHTFAITVSNTQSETTDSIITNTWRSQAKDWLLGFNISREM